MTRKLKNIELNRLSPEEFREAEKMPLVLVLDNIRSMSNVGSIFRTADAFRLEKLILCGITGCPPHKEIRKTALGADETVSWEHATDIVDALQKLRSEGYSLAALEQTSASSDIRDFELKAPLALVLGNEVEGVDDRALQLCEHILEIPQIGSKHSLNVAVSTGIAVWEILASGIYFKD